MHLAHRSLAVAAATLLLSAAFPVLAQESSSSSSVSSSASSTSAYKNQGQTIKAKCKGLTGQKRSACVRENASQRSRVVRRIARDQQEGVCAQFEIRTTAHRDCMRKQIKEMLETRRAQQPSRMNRMMRMDVEQRTNPRADMYMQMKLKMRMRGNTSSSAASGEASES